MTHNLPRIVFTPGEPSGIGPDIAIVLAQRNLPCCLITVADPELVIHRSRALGLEVKVAEWRGDPHTPGTLAVIPEPLRVSARTGRPDPKNSPYVLAALDRAVDGCLAGRFDALVTGPVHKGVISDSGSQFSGHTEYLARRTGSACPVMLLVSGPLRVALVTTHIPLADVSRQITRFKLESVIRVLAEELQTKLGISRPRIAVCGVNPHAGEDGHLGREEIEVIRPVLEKLKQTGVRASGPLSADTAFTSAQLANVDVVLTMYHDQGLPVIKYAAFGDAVNITLGLPIVRTSVDHGTALGLAGSGKANDRSLAAAIHAAIDIVRNLASQKRAFGKRSRT